ncbi:hypothetical protein SAMN03159338_1520 [Sphingomonas sp. NFR04]|jgi:hypothetical protein|uniref:hypothetical protein n=1 Tax=Sphingomonas sp. NFR04 TaxID=1566283 RepID=UPI0008F12ECA|nr:hypothetical protein [Sphingomonas sp. NFR04]SFJ48341.1 hypothetical protein SAMN03159338_1520 [Sphingomonas sp. NFR04]
MAEFTVTYAFNCRRYITATIEADTPAQAENLARAGAKEAIEAECLRLESMEGFGSQAVLDAALFLDAREPELGTILDGAELPELDE